MRKSSGGALEPLSVFVDMCHLMVVNFLDPTIPLQAFDSYFGP